MDNFFNRHDMTILPVFPIYEESGFPNQFMNHISAREQFEIAERIHAQSNQNNAEIENEMPEERMNQEETEQNSPIQSVEVYGQEGDGPNDFEFVREFNETWYLAPGIVEEETPLIPTVAMDPHSEKKVLKRRNPHTVGQDNKKEKGGKRGNSDNNENANDINRDSSMDMEF